jgi:hypothetical protein
LHAGPRLRPFHERSGRAGPEPATRRDPPCSPPTPDVETIDGWGRDATLYLTGFAFTPVDIESDGRVTAKTTTRDDWVREADPFLVQSGFVEREIHRVTRQFGPHGPGGQHLRVGD